MSRRLIINADDYGFTEGVCRGIREAHLRGIVSSTSAMMNMPGVEKELMEAVKNTSRLGLGVHLNLTAGYPLIEAENIPSMVDGDGRFFQHKSFVEHLGLINTDEARREWEEQVRYFIQITSRKPTHIDSHHHCSFLSPGLFRTMLMVAEKYQCAIRNIFTESPFTLSEEFPASKQDEIIEWSQSIAEEYHIAQPNHFHSSFFGKSATSSR